MKARQLKKNRYCPHCGRQVKYSRLKHTGGYRYECLHCDEDFFSFELEDNNIFYLYDNLIEKEIDNDSRS